MRPGFIILLFALSFAAYAQEGYLGSDHDKWHQSFYSMLQRPDGKGSCCNLTDCRPTSGRTVDGHYEVKVNGAWTSVPQAKVGLTTMKRERMVAGGRQTDVARVHITQSGRPSARKDV
jgi:hypothetical protein